MTRQTAEPANGASHRWTGWDGRTSGRRYALFFAASLVSHVAFFVGLSFSPEGPPSTAQATVQEFDVFHLEPTEPVRAEESPAVPPEPTEVEPPVRRARRAARRDTPPPTPEAVSPDTLPGQGSTQDAPAVAEASVVSTQGGLSINLAEGSGQGGASEGSGASLAPPAPEAEPEFDIRAAIRRYMRQVSREIGMPPYPRSATRAGIEGTVMVGLAITPSGAVNGVRVRRSSGHNRLDDAAIAFLRGLSRVPAPPSELDWSTREVTLPISYRLGANL
jgi:protein TonB